MKLFIFIKSRALPQNSVSVWADGTVHRKVSNGKWVTISNTSKNQKKDRLKNARLNFSTMSKIDLAGDSILSFLKDEYSINNFDDLVNIIKIGMYDTAHLMFKNTKDYLDKDINIPKFAKQAAIDQFGRCLLSLRNELVSSKKTKLTVKVNTGKGVYYRPKGLIDKEFSFKPTSIRYANKVLGNYRAFKNLPDSNQIKEMIKNGAAKLTYGKIDAKKKWVMKPKQTGIVIPFREGEKGIIVSLKQIKTMEKRTSRIAEVDITIPYYYAESFLKRQIQSVRTLNDLIGQLKRSKGFKEAIS